MPTHAEKRPMPYTPEQMFDMVADIEKYPEFLPWCTAARIRRREKNIIIADLMIGFKMVREKFTSRVELNRPHGINVAYAEGPFRHMDNHWVFQRMDDGGVLIDFYVDFEFHSKMLQKIVGTLFNEAVKLMVSAFQKRAAMLYGPDGRPPVQKRQITIPTPRQIGRKLRGQQP
ncbi:Putative oligoketide cyclase/lipid transport protein, similarity with yeast ubiquinone-binding protein YOL008W [invertebrate metagenome]|uniref:Oligoketide cyclase/lipid transport protein, similarity with yeast ubiquinone-binding protein YOL008W n=1 Tax=invertebrate metagenome TaxID=1711999 RepID=A0A484H5R1_9ZZZZ